MIFLFVNYLSDQAINLLNILLLRTTNTTTTLQPRILDDLNYNISSGHILCESPFESRFGTYAAAADVDVKIQIILQKNSKLDRYTQDRIHYDRERKKISYEICSGSYNSFTLAAPALTWLQYILHLSIIWPLYTMSTYPGCMLLRRRPDF